MLSTSPPGSAPLATSAGLPNVHGKNLGPEESANLYRRPREASASRSAVSSLVLARPSPPPTRGSP